MKGLSSRELVKGHIISTVAVVMREASLEYSSSHLEYSSMHFVTGLVESACELVA